MICSEKGNYEYRKDLSPEPLTPISVLNPHCMSLPILLLAWKKVVKLSLTLIYQPFYVLMREALFIRYTLDMI